MKKKEPTKLAVSKNNHEEGKDDDYNQEEEQDTIQMKPSQEEEEEASESHTQKDTLINIIINSPRISTLSASSPRSSTTTSSPAQRQSSNSSSVLKRCSSAESRVESSPYNSLLLLPDIHQDNNNNGPPKPRTSGGSTASSSSQKNHPLRQCILHRSSSSAASVPTGWWHQPQSDLWNEKYQMSSYLCSIGRLGKLYTCYSEQTGAELTVKVVRKSRWGSKQPTQQPPQSPEEIPPPPTLPTPPTQPTEQQGNNNEEGIATTTPSQNNFHSSVNTTTTGASCQSSVASVDKPKLPKRRSHYLHHPHRNHLQEYSILKHLQHPTILQVYDLIEDPRHYYIVTEYYNPNTQSLQAHLQEHHNLKELDVAPLMFQMIEAIHYCHYNSVVHCNLTLSSFCLVTPPPSTPQQQQQEQEGATNPAHPHPYPKVKLVDFANAVVLADLMPAQDHDHPTQRRGGGAANLRLMEPRGQIRYMAPEVITLDKSYGPKCDVWSLGIILYVLLSGEFPLDGTSFKDVKELVLNTLDNPHWLIEKFRSEPVWQDVTDEGKHFVHRLLAPLEMERPTPEHALQHPWMQPYWPAFFASTLQQKQGQPQPQPQEYRQDSCGVSTLSLSTDSFMVSEEFTCSVGSDTTAAAAAAHRFNSSILTNSTISQQPLAVVREGESLAIAPSLSGDSSLDLDDPQLFASTSNRDKQLELQQIEAIDTFLQCHDQIVKEWEYTNRKLLNNCTDIDLDRSFTRHDVRKAYKVLFNNTSELSDQDLDTVFAEFDVGGEDENKEEAKLQGMDFFVAILNEKDMLFTHPLQEAFEVFDVNHSGLVSTTYLSDALRRYLQNNIGDNHSSSRTVVEDLLDQVESDERELGTDVIALEEMVAMILESSIPSKAAATTTPATTDEDGREAGTSMSTLSSSLNKAPQRLGSIADEARDPIAGLGVSASSSSSMEALTSPSWGSSTAGGGGGGGRSMTSGGSRRSSSLRRRWTTSSLADRLSLKFSAKHFIAQRPGRLSHHYELTDFVNEGGCGAVWFCTHKETGMERAVKLVRKAQWDAQYNQRILQEFLILREMDHPNILKQYELFEDPNFFYIIMDAARGGDLCDELDEFGAFLEPAAALLMKQLLSCINYLHFSGFVHCDLKPENILLEANKELSQIKIIDFGFAANITKAPNQRLSKRWGTLQYTAPEVFAGDYGKKVDLWSAGVICFLLLSDEFPFYGNTKEELMQNVKKGAFSFSSHHWKHVSELGKDFVSKLLTLDEDKRLSANEALDHPWIRCMTESAMSELKPADFNATAQALSNLMKFSAKSKLKQATYTLIASQLLRKEEKQAIGSVFKRLDKTCNGRLTRTEIRLSLRNFLGVDLSDKEVDDVFRRVDVACTGYIEYSEFVMAAMSESWIVSSGLLRRAFDVFDVNKTGFITVDNLKVALAGFLTGDDTVDNSLIAKIVREVDTDGDGVIGFKDFVVAMAS